MPDGVRAVPPLERMLHLKRIPLLSGLPTAEVAAIADVSSERFFPKGAVVFREGDPASAMLFVVEGALGHFRRGVRLGAVQPGAGIEGLPVLAREAMSTEVIAEADTLTLEVDADAVAEVLEDRFPILQHLQREVNRQALGLMRRHRLDPNAFFPVPASDLATLDGLDLVDRLLLLWRMPVFERTSLTALAELARAMANVRFEPDTLLWHEGEPSHGILILSSGSVQATGSGGVRFRAGPGFPLGALEAVGQVPRWYDAQSLTPVAALQLQTDVLVDLFEDSFEMAMDQLALVARATLRMLDWNAAHAEPKPGPEGPPEASPLRGARGVD
jgi:CRP-like cAMP-binding protein